MRHQQKELQRLKQFLQPNELLLQIDFSENYVAKYESEIQSMHFGASKKQISLHTGVYYYRTESDALVKSQSFCSVSDNLDHQSHAIWAHLHTILLELANRFPNITQVHFLSDGPTSQYKNRNNCFLMCKKIPQYFKNIESMSWNYSESGHGKGPMDGVGGSLKRKADRLVLQGQDIICAGDFVHKLKESSVKIWEVLEEEIKDAKLEIPNNISQVPNIMSMHQVTWSKKFADKLFLRKLSCFACKFDEPCIHYSLKPSVVLIAAKTKNQILRNRNYNLLVPVGGTSKQEQYISPNLTLASKNCSDMELSNVSNVSSFSLDEDEKNTIPKIKIISNISLQTFERNVKETKGFCYDCTFSLNIQNEERKCFDCSRTYHLKCIVKHHFNKNSEIFLCPTCFRKYN